MKVEELHVADEDSSEVAHKAEEPRYMESIPEEERESQPGSQSARHDNADEPQGQLQ